MGLKTSDASGTVVSVGENQKKKFSAIKIIAASVGGLFAVAHIGLLGYVFRQEPEPVIQPPTFNLPRGPYSSYRIKAGKDGYEIEFRATILRFWSPKGL